MLMMIVIMVSAAAEEEEEANEEDCPSVVYIFIWCCLFNSSEKGAYITE